MINEIENPNNHFLVNLHFGQNINPIKRSSKRPAVFDTIPILRENALL